MLASHPPLQLVALWIMKCNMSDEQNVAGVHRYNQLIYNQIKICLEREIRGFTADYKQPLRQSAEDSMNIREVSIVM